MNPKLDIARIVIGLAEYYDKKLTPTQLDMYAEDLMELGASKLVQAVRLYRNDGRNDKFPLPSKLKAMVELQPDQQARDAVARIMTAISRIGPYQNAVAREFIGDLGWSVVTLQGGWEEVVKGVKDDNKGILNAQWRELAISLIKKNQLGLMDEKPGLEFKHSNPGQLKSFAGVLLDIRKAE